MIEQLSCWRWNTAIGIACIAVVQCGCNQQSHTSLHNKPASSNIGVQSHALGWLGGTAEPATGDVCIPAVEESAEPQYVGGIVLQSVAKDGPLAAAGMQSGDVIVGVADTLLPNKEDPTLDFFALVESEVSAAQSDMRLTYLRAGEKIDGTFPIDLAPLENGLPLNVERFDAALRNGLAFLASQQQDDGSFGTRPRDANSQISVASLAGLAMCVGTAGDEYAEHIDRCRGYVTELIPKSTGDASATAESPSPLAVSYALMFLSESQPPLGEGDGALVATTLQPLTTCLSRLLAAQHDSGGWMTSQATVANDDGEQESSDLAISDTADGDKANGDESRKSDGHAEIDVVGTFATNQVLLALGVAARNGIMGADDAIEKAVTYLKDQGKKRIASRIDRRVKAGLDVGTAAAMLCLNIDPNDAFLLQIIKDSRKRWNDIYHGPTLNLPHTWTLAITSRMQGVPSWIGFHEGHKVLAASLQQPNGRFVKYSGLVDERIPLEQQCDSPTWETAHWCLILALQRKEASAFTGEKTHPMLADRNGDGSPKKSGSSTALNSANGAIPKGAKVISISGGSMEEIMEQLKEQGIDIDEGHLRDAMPSGAE